MERRNLQTFIYSSNSRCRSKYSSEDESESEGFDSHDIMIIDIPLARIAKEYKSSFHELLPTPNYAVTKNKSRSKAINYRGLIMAKQFDHMGQKQKKNLKIAVLNIRSLLVKFADFKNTVVNSGNFDIIALTETWLNQNVDSDLLSLDGYQLFRNDRIDSRGGGVLIYIANRIRCSKIDLISSIEQLWITFKIGAVSFCFGVIYRPPKSNVYDFINQFQDSLSYLCPRYDQMVCTGDFNIDFLDRNAKAVKLFDDSMDAFGLHQVITAPTRFGVSSETLLDLFFCSEGIECSFDITDVSNLSDHCLVSVDLQYLIDIKQTTVIRSYRDFKNFDLEAFKLALEETDFMQIVNYH
nr:unnamed protein product [Callosobruchus chinensis]